MGDWRAQRIGLGVQRCPVDRVESVAQSGIVTYRVGRYHYAADGPESHVLFADSRHRAVACEWPSGSINHFLKEGGRA